MYKFKRIFLPSHKANLLCYFSYILIVKLKIWWLVKYVATSDIKSYSFLRHPTI